MNLSTHMYGEDASYGDGSKHGDNAFLERIKRLRRYVFCSLGREGAEVGRRGCNRWVRGMFRRRSIPVTAAPHSLDMGMGLVRRRKW